MPPTIYGADIPHGFAKGGFTPPYRIPDTKEGRLLACLLLIYRNHIKMSFDGWFSGEEAGGLW